MYIEWIDINSNTRFEHALIGILYDEIYVYNFCITMACDLVFFCNCLPVATNNLTTWRVIFDK